MNFLEILINLDFSIFKILYSPSPYTIYLIYFTELIFLFYLLFAYFYFKKKNSRWKRLFFYAFFGYLFVLVLKIFFGRPRPYEDIDIFFTIEKFEKSFPSTHAFLSSMLVNFVPDIKWRKYFIMYAIAVSFSLIVSGVHYPSDVLVGSILGYIFPKYIIPERRVSNIKFFK